jgi:hypothetical protein
VSVTATADIEELYSRASKLLRNHDQLGWKQLVRNTRSTLPTALADWRARAEPTIRTLRDNAKKELFSWMNEGFGAIGPLVVLALVAVDSEQESLREQRALLDDLFNLQAWNMSGSRSVINAPHGFAFAYHQVLGACLVTSRRYDEAVNLLRTKTPILLGSEEIVEVWESPEMMGWTDALGGKVTDGWDFLTQLYSTHAWLSHFFVSETDYQLGLRAYLFIAALLETSRIARSNEEPGWSRVDGPFPPTTSCESSSRQTERQWTRCTITCRALMRAGRVHFVSCFPTPFGPYWRQR